MTRAVNYAPTELAKKVRENTMYKVRWLLAVICACVGFSTGIFIIKNTTVAICVMITHVVVAILLLVKNCRGLDINQKIMVDAFLSDYHALVKLCGLKWNRLLTFGNVHDGLSEDLQNNLASNPQVVMCAAYGWQAMREIAEEIALAETEVNFMKEEGGVVDEARWKKLCDQLSEAIATLQQFGFVDPDEEKVRIACYDPTGPGKIWVPKPPQFVSSSFKRKLCAMLVSVILRRG